MRLLSAVCASIFFSTLVIVGPAHSRTVTLEITGTGSGNFVSPSSTFTGQAFDFHLVGPDSNSNVIDLTIASVTIGASTVDFTNPMHIGLHNGPDYAFFGYQSGGPDLIHLVFSPADFLLLGNSNSFFGPATVNDNLFTGVPTSGGLLSFTDFSEVNLTANSTPLPAALPLFAGGLGVIGLLARRKKRRTAAALATA
jgi:hypothetical protein